MLWPGLAKNRHWIDNDRVRSAILAAEQRTSGEIRVSLAPWFWGSVERAAERAFDRLGLHRTRERNGILFFIVPSRRRFVVLGDRGIHARVGEKFWQDVAGAMSEKFRRAQFTDGLVAGIAAAADALAEHFPFDPNADVNELPDEVDSV